MSFFMLAKWDLKGIICCDVFNKHGRPGSFPFPWISQIGQILKCLKLWCRSSNCRLSRHGQPIFDKNREIIFLCSRFFLWLWLKSEAEEESVLLTFTLLLIWNSKMCMKKVILIWYPDFGASDRLSIWHKVVQKCPCHHTS